MSASATTHERARATAGIDALRRAAEPVTVLGAALAVATLVLVIARSATAVYFTPDGAHAVTDAWALIGRAPHEAYYLPGWPVALLPFLLAGLGPVTSIGAALAVTAGALFVGLYLLVRPALGSRAAFVGAIAGTLSTMVAEVLGWQGGPTLFGLVMTTYLLAALEQWDRRGQARFGFLAVAAWAVAIATHPFMGVIATGLGGLRFVAALVDPADGTGTRGPRSARWVVAVAVPAILAAVAVAPRYLLIDAPTGSALRTPDFLATVQIWTWITRESPALMVLSMLFGLAALTTRLSLRLIALGVLAQFLLVPAFLSGDTSYQSRVAYVLPILFAIGAGAVWTGFQGQTARHFPSASLAARSRPAVEALLAAVLIASIGFPVRLSSAAPYYGRLVPDDVALLSSLAGQQDQIVTSWTGNRYWDGMGKAWYAEGLTDRAAFGPSDPAMLTRLSERAEASAAWRLFSGQQGMENGALQVAFGPSAWRADPAIAANVTGYYIPLVYVNEHVNQEGQAPGVQPSLDWRLDGSGKASATRPAAAAAPAGLPKVNAQVELSGDTVRLAWQPGPASARGEWTVYLWPAYGVPWKDVTRQDGAVTVHPQGAYAVRASGAWATADPSLQITPSGSTRVAYIESDPVYHVQVISLVAPAGQPIEASIKVSGTQPAGAVATYDEPSILRQEHVGTIAVWQDTGWTDRFAKSPCYAPAASDASISAFDVLSTCQ